MTILNVDRNPVCCDYPDIMPDIANAMQATIADSVKLSGVGLHSGKAVNVSIHPAKAGTGILFTDGSKYVKAIASNVIDTSRGTTIGQNGISFKTIEHLMASLRGFGIDNAVVEFSGGETPALDGSAYEYASKISKVGVEILDEPRNFIELKEPVLVQNNGSYILAVPSDEIRYTYVLRYDHPMIGSDVYTYNFADNNFAADIAQARTFVLYEEVAHLLEQNLAKGGSIDNVIVIWQDHLSSELRYSDELVRHKMLDMIGDLSLCGGILKAEVLSVKSGHTLNTEFAKVIEGLSA